MPLRLGGVETARPQLVCWDPASYAEQVEARQRVAELERSGFTVESVDHDGEIRMAPPQRDPNHGCMRILSQNGDDRLVWDRRNAGEVREASQKFRDLMAEGHTAYAVRANGSRGHRVDDFDPGLEEIVMVPTKRMMPG
jgi:hypothetical protein